MYPTLFKIGSLSFPSYFVFSLIGYLAGILLSIYIAKKKGVSVMAVFDYAVIVSIAALFGSKLGHLFLEATAHKTKSGVKVTGILDLLQRDPWHPIRFTEGGYVWYGGLILALIVSYFYLKKKKMPLMKYLDILTPGGMLGLGIGRIGCFLAGCCYGKQTDLFWGVVFTQSIPKNLRGLHLHPTQLLSAINAFALMFILLIILLKTKIKTGATFGILMIVYPITRFIIEYLRGDADRMVYLGGLASTSQILSLLLIPIGIFTIYKAYSGKTENQDANENEVALETNQDRESQDTENQDANENEVALETNQDRESQDTENQDANENEVVSETNQDRESQDIENQDANENEVVSERNQDTEKS